MHKTHRRARPFRRLEALLGEAGLSDHPMLAGLNLQERTDLEAGIIWRATRDYRLACVGELAPFEPVVYGDAGWEQSLHGSFTLKAEVNYYEELPLVYGGSDISFNATSLQMKAAVNQRVFDVPAAGGFLLTDFREQLGEVMEVGKEAACYRDPGEFPELVRFYLKNGTARREMVGRARARVLAEHTYIHRLTRIEGHGNIRVCIEDGRLREAAWEIVETPRFFEVMLQGKHYSSVPMLTARICGICSIGHCLASLRATEQAFGVTIPKAAGELRLLAKHGETLQSHYFWKFQSAGPV